jgi:hypothetical protein
MPVLLCILALALPLGVAAWEACIHFSKETVVNTRVQTLPSSSWTRPLIAIAAISALALSLLSLARPLTVMAWTQGDNGHPTSGPYSDLKGGTATFTFKDDATMYCDANSSVTGFNANVSYSVSNGPLPSGATLVIYLSPNNGALPGGAADAGFIADVESNYTVVDVSGLNGSGTLDPVSITISKAFVSTKGGILGTFASEAGENGQVWKSNTNSLNCSEATSTPTPTPVEQTPTPTPVEQTPTPTPVEQTPTPTPVEQTPTPTPVEQTPTPTPTTEGSVSPGTGTPAPTPTTEQSVEAGTGTPAASVPNTAIGSGSGSMQLPTILFGVLLVASLGGLLILNVKSATERR